MNIASTQYSINTKSFEIYFSGCNGSCKGCCNPELKVFNKGNKIDKVVLTDIIEKIHKFSNMIDSIWLLGGDPIDQNISELDSFIHSLKVLKKEIWLWTRYDLDNIPDNIKILCDYIKTGEFIPELKTEYNIQYDIKLATSNQKISKKGIDYEN